MSGISKWFADTRVRNKILLGYGIVLVLTFLIGLVVLIQAGRIRSANEELRTIEDVLVSEKELSAAFSRRTTALAEYAITGQETSLEAFRNTATDLNETIEDTRALFADSGQIQQLNEVISAIQLWTDSVAGVLVPLRQATLQPGGPPFEAVQAFYNEGTARSYESAVRGLLADLEQREHAIAADRQAAVDEAVESMRLATILFTILSAILASLVAIWIAQRISRPLIEAVEFAEAVAAGDLTRQAHPSGNDEVGQLTATLNGMASDLRNTVSGVSAAITQVASASEQIAAASEQISSTVDLQVRSTEEASSSMEEIAAQINRVAQSTESLSVSVEETSSSIGEMSTSIEQTATSTDALGVSVEETSATIEEMVTSIAQTGRHIEETREIARAAESDARTGGGAVVSSVEGMRRIHSEMENLVERIRQLGSTSESIGQISKLIEDIADQTNLLALNAAIEAARAGEHGRGFAVVAQEIRRLAERSVESTREIGSTIREVREEVKSVVTSTEIVGERTREGIELADSAGAALEKIIESASRTLTLMEEVSLATNQQISAADQAQEAIRHIQGIAEEARIATREQATGSRQIVEAVENMSRQTRLVFAATAEQKKGGEMIVESTENISSGARATQGAIREMTRAAQDLSTQAARLTELVNSFRV
ncbi:MAG TPA: methyl-accepting chemotaxis protein [Longimicrobiaceae bacterium]|nr:methyl-accepting chemotaxis protein [Longimicrobiaceae bacterium]